MLFTLMLPAPIHKLTNEEPLVTLLDSSSSQMWINHRYLFKGINGRTNKLIKSQTLAGPFQANGKVNEEGIIFLEFFKTWDI